MKPPFLVADPAPYPPLRVSGPNLRAAMKLSQGLACPKSELSAVAAYEYQHWTLAKREPELADTVRRVGQVEMHHLDILGRLIVLLGGDPRFACEQRGGRIFWNGGMISCCQEVRHVLLGNIADEQKAAEFYRTAAAEMTDPGVAAVLRRLALDEALHVEIFTRFLKTMPD